MRDLYQTLRNDENADEVEAHGPYECKDNVAWLGQGYYFWYFIPCAHWWGKTQHDDNYFICKTQCTGNSNELLDLACDMDAMQDLAVIVENYRQEHKNIGRFTLRDVIEDLRGWYKQANVKAVSLRTENTINFNSFGYLFPRIYFNNHLPAFAPLYPPIQICVIDKSYLVGDFLVIFPESYSSGYCI